MTPAPRRDPALPLAVKYEAAKRAISQCARIDEVADWYDKFMALACYARQANDDELLRMATRIQARAMRRCGELLREIEPAKNQYDAHTGAGTSRTQAAAKAGLSKRQKDTALRVAAVPEAEFERLIESETPTVTQLAERGTRKLDQQREKDALIQQIQAETPQFPRGPFRVIVVDPPWPYAHREEDPRHRGRTPYPTMTLAEIHRLPVSELAREDCTLWLWATNTFLHEAFDCLDAWGFTYKTLLTWIKHKMGLGDWLRGQTEHCLMAVRGHPVVTLTNQTTALFAPVREHSRKPDAFFALVESLCPGNRVDLFAREQRPGWKTWGVETAKFTAAAHR